MATALDFEAAAFSLRDAAVFFCKSRFVLGDVEISGGPSHVRLRMAPLFTETIEAIFAMWASAEPLNGDEPAPMEQVAVPSEAVWAQHAVPSEAVWAQHVVPSEAVWAQHAVPSEAVWAQHVVPSEAVWAQHAVPSEAVWAQHAVPLESVKHPASPAEFNGMFASLAFIDPAKSSWTPVTIVGRRDGRRCAIAIARASKVSLVSCEEIRIDADPSGPQVSVAKE